MIDSSLYPHEFLYAGVVYLEDGSSRWQTNVLLDISSAPTIYTHYIINSKAMLSDVNMQY